MKVVLESPIEAHAPELYRADAVWSADRDREAERQYDDLGFVVGRAMYSDEEVAAARAELREMTHTDHPRCESVYLEGSIRERLGQRSDAPATRRDNPRFAELALGSSSDRMPELPPAERARYVRKFMGFTEYHPALRRLAEKPELIQLVERLLGEEVRLYQDMAMIKPPGGREKPWHQDHAYFNLPLGTRVVGVWIALDRVTPVNGCMHVAPGAHRDGPRVHFMRRDWQLCDRDAMALDCLAIPMEAGDALLFDAKLPHGTPTNQTDDFRWAIQLHYVPTSACPAPEEVRLAAFGSEGKNVSC